MKLCHLLTLKSDKVSHSIIDVAAIDGYSRDSLLAGPFLLSFYPYTLAVKRHDLVDLRGCAPIDPDVIASYSMLTVDDLENRPLINESSEARSLFLLAELNKGIFESARAMGLSINFVDVDLTSQCLRVEISFVKGQTGEATIGALLCFITAFDYLLYSRSLRIHSSLVEISKNKSKTNETLSWIEKILTHPKGLMASNRERGKKSAASTAN